MDALELAGDGLVKPVSGDEGNAERGDEGAALRTGAWAREVFMHSGLGMYRFPSESELDSQLHFRFTGRVAFGSFRRGGGPTADGIRLLTVVFAVDSLAGCARADRVWFVAVVDDTAFEANGLDFTEDFGRAGLETRAGEVLSLEIVIWLLVDVEEIVMGALSDERQITSSPELLAVVLVTFVVCLWPRGAFNAAACCDADGCEDEGCDGGELGGSVVKEDATLRVGRVFR